MNSFVKTKTVSYPEFESMVKELKSKEGTIYTYAEMVTQLFLEQDVKLPTEDFYSIRYFYKQGELTVRPSGKDQVHLVYIGDNEESDFLIDSTSLALHQDEEDHEYFLEKRPFQPFNTVKVRKYTSTEGTFYRWVEVKK
jgi:hypothetical protein